MSATADEIFARLVAILPSAPGVASVVNTAAALAAATLPAVEVYRPRRSALTRLNADMGLVAQDWELWEYLQAVVNPEDEDAVKAIFDTASDRLTALPVWFRTRPRLELNGRPLDIWDTNPITTEAGLLRRNKTTYAALRHTLPIVLQEDTTP